MFALPQRLVWNEDVFKSLPTKKRSVLVYEWLCSLHEALPIPQTDDVRECQSQIVEQLLQLIPDGSNSSIRMLIARNLVILFSMDSRSSLFGNTVHRCIGILKSNDETAQLTAVVILGAFYERLGRFPARSSEEIVLLLLRIVKNGDSHMRCEVLHALEHVINGVGSASRTIHREIHKRAKIHLCDRLMSIRLAATRCLIALINQNNSMYTSELEGNIASGMRAFEGANYDVRHSVAKYLAVLLAASQDVFSDANQSKTSSSINRTTMKVEKILNYLSGGFRHGNLNLLKSNTTEQSKELTGIQYEIRAGITYTYIELIGILGTTWMEQNLSLLINHLIELAGNPRLSISRLDAISSRKCVSFILRSVIGSHLGEKVQFILAKELTAIITRCVTPQSIPNSTAILTNDLDISSMNSSTNSMTQSYGSTNQYESSPSECYENILVCALHELSLLIRSFGASTLLLLQDSCNGLIDTLFFVILNPSQAVRIATAWCFRSIAVVLPSLMTPLIDQCLGKMNDSAKQANVSNTDAMSGFALVLQALLGAVHQCPLGIPSQRAKRIFKFADNLLRTTIASTAGEEQSLIPCLILQRTSTVWYLISACCTLDQDLRKKLLSRLILLWRYVFPRSTADFEQEKRRGDSLTWLLSLNQRSGALCSMISFLNHRPTAELHWSSKDLLEHMMNPIENAISILFHTSNLIRQFGHQLKTSTTIFRLRLYELLLLIPCQSCERHFRSLLQELTNEFTLVDSSLNSTTSLLRSICQENYPILFGDWIAKTDDQLVEEQLHPHSTGDWGVLENDETYLHRRDASSISFSIVDYLFPSPSSISDGRSNGSYSHPAKLSTPEPFPPNIAVIDISIRLFAEIFACVSDEHRLDTLEHLIDSIEQAKDSRQETIQINVLTAILLSLKTLVKTKEVSSFDNEDHLKKCTSTLIIQTLNHSNPILRCVSAEALGHLIQIFPDDWLIEHMIRYCFDHLNGSRDVSSQTGYSLGLACLYRQMDDLNKEQYLDLFISVLHTVIENQSTTIVQVWALHALNSIAKSTGQMLRNHVELLLKLISDLLLSSSSSQIDIHRCCSRLLSTLIISIGSDLQTNTNSSSMLCSSCLTLINLLQMHIEPVVQAEAVQALQELHLFAPQHVQFSTLIPILIKALISRDLSFRRTCISCLRRLTQRKAKEVHKHAKLLFRSDSEEHSSSELIEFQSLEALLFSILDAETDAKVRSDIQEILLRILETVEPDRLPHCLQLFSDILAEKSNMKPSSNIEHLTESFAKSSSNTNLSSDDDDTDAGEQLQTTTEENVVHCSTLPTKWQTKLFAIDCVQNLLNYYEQTAQSPLLTYSGQDYLVAQLPTLITSSFLACTSIHDPLRLSGLSLLKQIILKSAQTNENSNACSHILLKRHQAHIGAALRPAFSRRTPSNVTAHACDVCHIWILSETGWDLADWRRVHQLLISSLQKFTSIQQQFQNEANMVYNETAVTFENLAILKLWADVYNFALEQRNNNPHCNLLLLIQTELYIVIHHWLAVLADYACLMLPKEFHGIDAMNCRGGNFYSTESDIDIIKRVYKTAWPSIIQAAVQWLVEHRYELEISSANQALISHRQRDLLMTKLLTSTLANKSRRFPEKKEDIFAMILGCCVDALSISVSEQTDETVERILISFIHLLQSDISVSRITMEICVELVHSLHRLSVVHADIQSHLKITKALQRIFHHSSSSTTSIHSIIDADLVIPDESFLSAVLELLVSIFSNYFPVKQNNTKTFQVIELITSTVSLLHELITLNLTNQNIRSSVPVILHLLLSTSFLLLSIESDQQKPLLSQILQLMENLFSTSMSTAASHSAMITIMNLRANLLEKDLSDNGYFVRCLTSLIKHFNAIKITTQMIDFYQKTFDDRDHETHLHILGCLNDLFQAKNILLRNKFIQIFVPLLLIELKQTGDQPILIEILKTFETVLTVADSTSRLRLASLIIPIFAHFLPHTTSLNVDTLASYVTERLEYLHSIYPNEFRFIAEASPDLRSKLENTVGQKQQKRTEK